MNGTKSPHQNKKAIGSFDHKKYFSWKINVRDL